MVIVVFVQRIVVPMRGGVPNETLIAEALPQAERALAAIEGLMGGEEFLCGGTISLADLHLLTSRQLRRHSYCTLLGLLV